MSKVIMSFMSLVASGLLACFGATLGNPHALVKWFDPREGKYIYEFDIDPGPDCVGVWTDGEDSAAIPISDIGDDEELSPVVEPISASAAKFIESVVIVEESTFKDVPGAIFEIEYDECDCGCETYVPERKWILAKIKESRACRQPEAFRMGLKNVGVMRTFIIVPADWNGDDVYSYMEGISILDLRTAAWGDDSAGGKVRGGGLYKPGKTVTLKATPDRGSIFMGWYDGAKLLSQASSYKYTTTDEDVTLTAKFITTAEDAANVNLTLNGGEVSSASAQTPTSTNIMCGVAVNWPVAVEALSATTVKVSGLPSGMKFTDKGVLKKGSKTEYEVEPNTIYGAPSAASKYDNKLGALKPSPVKIEVTTAGKTKVGYVMNVTVDALPAWAVGNFEGYVVKDDNDGGTATMSVTSAGKISGKIAYGGTNWTFKADSFAADSVYVGETNLVVSASATAGKATCDFALDVNSISLGYLEDSATARGEGTFDGVFTQLERIPWTDKNDKAPAAYIASYAGAYSCVVPYGDDEGDVTFVLDEKGKIKGAIALPGGSKTRKVSFAGNALPKEGTVYATIYSAPDLKKGYEAAFKVFQLVNSSDEDPYEYAVRDPGVIADTIAYDDPSASGKVSVNPKYGQAAPGKDVTLTAKADKGNVFVEWALDDIDTEGLDLKSATLKFKLGEGDVHATAVFATSEEDAKSLDISFGANYDVESDGSFEMDMDEYVYSLSAPKLTVKGLPKGLKFDAKTRKITGTATAPGVYTVSVKATNLSDKKGIDGAFTITVPNLSCDALPYLEPATDAYNPLTVGIAMEEGLVDCTPEDGWTVKVSGLPAGLKHAAKDVYDAKTKELLYPANSIYGVPTKPGAYTVYFTATRGREKQTATITLYVEPLPEWVVGTFYGSVCVKYGEEYEWPNAFEVKVSSVGAVSMNIIDVNGKTQPSAIKCTSLTCDDDGYAFTWEWLNGSEHSVGDCKISPRDYGSDGFFVGALEGTEYGVDEDGDDFISEILGYQDLYGKKADVVLPTFTADNVLELSVEDGASLELTFKAKGAVAVKAYGLPFDKHAASHMVPFGVDPETGDVYAYLWIIGSDKEEDWSVGIAYELVIPVDSVGLASASKITANRQLFFIGY